MDWDALFEYYLTGGAIHMEKRQATLELLRSGSALRFLFGHGAGNVQSMLGEPVKTEFQSETVVLEWSRYGERRLGGDPTPVVRELKDRCGDGVSGTLYFRVFYRTRRDSFHLLADLDSGTVRQL